MDSQFKLQGEVVPLDAYVAIQHHFGLDSETIETLRRKRVFDGLERDDAVRAVTKLVNTFGPPLAKRMLLENGLGALAALKRLDPRTKLLTRACQDLTAHDVLTMAARAPIILTMDNLAWDWLLDSAKRLVPDEQRLGHFLFAFPQYFAQNPQRVSEFLAKQQTADPPATLRARPQRCRVATAGEVAMRAGRFPLSAQPAGMDTSDQNGDLLSLWCDLYSFCISPKAFGADEPPAEAGTDKTAIVSSPVADETKDPIRRALLDLLEQLRYLPYLNALAANRLKRELGSWEKAFDFVNTLFEAGWNGPRLNRTLEKSSPHPAIGAARLLEMQNWFVRRFGLAPEMAIRVLAERPHLCRYDSLDLEKCVRHAVPDLEPAAVGKLLLSRIKIFRSVTHPASPTGGTGIAVCNQQSAVCRPRTTRSRQPRPPMARPAAATASCAVPPKQEKRERENGKRRLAAYRAAGWTGTAARAHLQSSAFARIMSVRALSCALQTLADLLGLRNQTFARRLTANARRLVKLRQELRRGSDECTETDAWSWNLVDLDLELQSRKLAGEVFLLKKKTLKDALTAMSPWGFTQAEASDLFRARPEFLTDNARPIAAAHGFVRRFGVHPLLVRRNLESEVDSVALFEDPGFLFQHINALRRIDVDFEALGISPAELDFAHAWHRVYTPPEELCLRLRAIRQAGLRARDFVPALFLPVPREDFKSLLVQEDAAPSSEQRPRR